MSSHYVIQGSWAHADPGIEPTDLGSRSNTRRHELLKAQTEAPHEGEDEDTPQEGQMCRYVLLKWYCDDCGAWYTSDLIKTVDCADFVANGECDVRDMDATQSEAGGLCSECSREA
ncbi:hypothetical protein F4777DRAFT_579996 [Nemania sp. FL0916]|nr:hypothetical protein F4777DRAFT_579996 [Nemania sp. FL0916]